MSTDIISIVSTIPDRQPVSVTLTDPDGRNRKVRCVFKESEAPGFFLLFSPGAMPEDIEEDWRCIVSSRTSSGEAVTFKAKIIQVQNTRVIELEGQKTLRPEDLREYFRVNLKSKVSVFYDPANGDPKEEPFELDGETVDISESGVLTILSNECRIKKSIMIELNLPNPNQVVICSGSVIRSKRITKSRWLTAFHFENISTHSREIIAKNCFSEQRRQLRENIRTAG